MIDLPYKRKFTTIPEIDKRELVDYFNLELAGDSVGLGVKKYQPDDFVYIGVIEVDGFERMYWQVADTNLCAMVRPYEDTYIIEMDSLPVRPAK